MHMKTLNPLTHSHGSSTSTSNALYKLCASEWYGGCLCCKQGDSDLCDLVPKLVVLPTVPLESKGIFLPRANAEIVFEGVLRRQIIRVK